MASSDGDKHMPDIDAKMESAMVHHPLHPNFRPVPGADSIQNRVRDQPRTDFGHINGSPLAPSPIINNGERQTFVPANQISSPLSMEHHTSFSSTEGDFEDEEMDEHDDVAPYSSFLPTGYCYDVRMRYHCELDPPQERRELHPEDPRRIFKIYQELCVAGLIENEMLNTGRLIPNPLMNIPVREATEAEVELVHDKRHWDFMFSTQSKPALFPMRMQYNRCLPPAKRNKPR